jgi:uncharacterized RDD family membrane protein YckC
LARVLTIITPENIPLTLELAGLGSRCGALLLDVAILVGLHTTVWIIGALVASVLSETGLGGIWIAIPTILSFLVQFGYFIFFDTRRNGQTPGKKALGLRVITDDGFPVTFFPSATRSLIWLIDLTTGIGALTVFFQPRSQRLGDIVAGTLVVKERAAGVLRYGPTGPPQHLPTHLAGARLAPTVRNPLDILTDAEQHLVRRFALRRAGMSADDAERFAYRLVGPLVERLQIRFTPQEAPRYADLACVLALELDRQQQLRDDADHSFPGDGEVGQAFRHLRR